MPARVERIASIARSDGTEGVFVGVETDEAGLRLCWSRFWRYSRQVAAHIARRLRDQIKKIDSCLLHIMIQSAWLRSLWFCRADFRRSISF